MEELKYLKTVEEIRAFMDPFRLDILRKFYSLGKPATVKQIADEMNEVPSKIHYHVKKLEKFNILELHHTEEIKGIIAKFYLPTAKSFQTIQRDDKLDPKIYLSEAQQLACNVIDGFKKNITNIIKEKFVGISSQDLYLTDEEFEEFTNMVIKFFDKHKVKKDDPNKKPHDFLFCYVGNRHEEYDYYPNMQMKISENNDYEMKK